MKMHTVGMSILMLAASAPAQANQTKPDCEPLVLQSGSATMGDVTPQPGEKYRRPPMVAYDVLEDGSVANVRIVRKSGIRELDGKLYAAALQWKYQARPGCKVAKVRMAAGAIPDAATALKVGEPELMRAYGGVLGSEKPITAILWGDIWTVGGTLHCPGEKNSTELCLGGVATLHLTKSDGRIIEVFHTM